MRKISSVSYALIGSILVALLTSACVSGRLPKGSAAYVHVAANGVVTFHGEPVQLDDLANKLKKAGVTRDTPIKIVPQGDVSDRLLRSIAGNMGRHGLPRVVILEPRKAIAIVGGKTVAEVVSDEIKQDAPTPQP